ncbi:MAG: helix-turn-helix transcriptional regulator [Chloroflexi bacterium]|nr:MAG: helix-turn-helix transcriptional regulator [Chloroflexota bacterium]
MGCLRRSPGRRVGQTHGGLSARQARRLILPGVDAVRIGRQFRALRVRKQVRQLDIGRASKLSRPIISRIERGLIESMTIGTLIRAAAPLGAAVDMRLRWNGEQLERLLDEAHAQLVEHIVVMLRARGWDVAVEVSFSVWGNAAQSTSWPITVRPGSSS